VLFRVLFGEFVQLLAEIGVLDVERDRKKGRGEQQQPKQHANED
jgi:hypothetical protein